MKYLLMLLLVPVLASAANCFIWNYQTTDTLYDAEAGATVDHTYWLRQILAGQGHTFVMDTLLPSNTSEYDVVFAMCGWYNC